ncbi:MAG: S-layer protein [Candidatus Thiodiazotropha sp. (ex Ustalcina ferruginea)]|nr:S-layer protein [Candidatus Thiodiazotropha sp. (ex Ustalcina ferruginea)]
MHESLLGWDLGGAHIKTAHLDQTGCVRSVIQWPCPLWRGLDRLESGIDAVMGKIGDWKELRHAVTMTGELVDLFPDRASGVITLIDVMSRRFSKDALTIYAGKAGFLTPDKAMIGTSQVASANWLASVSLVAARLQEGLFIDVGSTTTDLIPFSGNLVRASGFDDHHRLAQQELIYTGIVRTPLMAVTPQVPFAGEWVPLMAEYFATTADIYRLTGELPEEVDLLPSADNGEKGMAGSTRRLARMLGLDADATDLEGWRRVSHFIAERQLGTLMEACERILSRPVISASAPLVGAGAGRFLVEKLSRRLNRPYIGFESLITCRKQMETKVAECAPAVAVAFLAAERGA